MIGQQTGINLTQYAKENAPKGVNPEFFQKMLQRKLSQNGLNAKSTSKSDVDKILFERDRHETTKQTGNSRPIIVFGHKYPSITDACEQLAPAGQSKQKFIEMVRKRLKKIGWNENCVVVSQCKIDEAFKQKKHREIKSVEYQGKTYRSFGQLFEAHGMPRQQSLRKFNRYNDGQPDFLERFMQGEPMRTIHEAVILPTVMQQKIETAVDYIVTQISKTSRVSPNKTSKVIEVIATLFKFSDDKQAKSHINEKVIEHLTKRFEAMFSSEVKPEKLSLHAEDFRSNMKVTLAHLLQK